MKFLKVSVENFMPFRDEQTIRFPTSEHANTMLVFGNNGGGKTSILNTFRFGLYGYALNRSRDRILRLDLINSEAAAADNFEMKVQIEFEHEGDEYQLRRIMRPKELVHRPTCDNDFMIEAHLRKGNQVIAGHEIEGMVQRLFPEQISRFFLFDGELLDEYDCLLKKGSEQATKIQESIELILGVPALINGRTQTSKLLNDARKAQHKANRNIDSQKSRVRDAERLQAEVDAIEVDKDQLEGMLVKKRATLEQLEQQLAATNEAERAQGELTRIRGQIAGIANDYKVKTQERSNLLQSAWLDLLQPQVIRLQEAGEAASSENMSRFKETTILDKELNDMLTALEADQCSTCEQPVPPKQKEAMEAKVAQLRIRLEGLAFDPEAMTRLNVRLQKLRKLTSNAEGVRIAEIEQAMEQATMKRMTLENEQQQLLSKIRDHDTADIARKRKEHSAISQEVGRLKGDIGKLGVALAEKQKTLKGLSDVINSSPERDQKTSLLLKQYTQLNDLFEMGISELRDNLREEVNRAATDTFIQLINEPGYSGLSINEHYGLRMLDNHKRVVKEPSAGQAQIVALSLIDALTKMAGKGPIIIDTPLGRLDPTHRGNILKYLPTMAEQVVLLVHEGEISRDDAIMDELKPRVGGVYEFRRHGVTRSSIEESSL